MLVPAWLVGTVMGKNAQNIIAANAETGALMRFAPAGKSRPSAGYPATRAETCFCRCRRVCCHPLFFRVSDASVAFEDTACLPH